MTQEPAQCLHGNDSSCLHCRIEQEVNDELLVDFSQEVRAIVGLNKYKLSKWRLYLLERDQHQCQLCLKKQEPGRLAAHHISPKSMYPEDAYLLWNGVILCNMICHMDIVHTGNSFDVKSCERFASMFSSIATNPVNKQFSLDNQKYI